VAFLTVTEGRGGSWRAKSQLGISQRGFSYEETETPTDPMRRSLPLGRKEKKVPSAVERRKKRTGKKVRRGGETGWIGVVEEGKKVGSFQTLSTWNRAGKERRTVGRKRGLLYRISTERTYFSETAPKEVSWGWLRPTAVPRWER